MERRRHPRSNLRLSLFLVKTGCPDPIQTQTENVSKDGFFTFIDLPLLPGEILKFVLLLPDVSEIERTAARICLHGELRVIRTCPDFGSDRFGIGCQLTSYRILPDCEIGMADDLVAKLVTLALEPECVRPN